MAAKKPAYDPLSEDEAETPAAGGDPNDPFADPTDFLGSIGGSSGFKSRGKERMECELLTKIVSLGKLSAELVSFRHRGGHLMSGDPDQSARSFVTVQFPSCHKVFSRLQCTMSGCIGVVTNCRRRPT